MRELRDADAEQVAALFVRCFGDARKLDAEEIRSWLRNSEFRPEWLRVLEDDGRIVGYADIWPQDDELAVDVAASGHEDALFDWAEAEAADRGIARVRTQVPHGHDLARIVEARGYSAWRHSLTMEIALAEEPPPAALPDGLELRSYRDGDRDTVIAAVNEAFAQDPFHHTSSGPRPPRCTRAGCGGWASASTPRTSPVPSASTSGWGCGR